MEKHLKTGLFVVSLVLLAVFVFFILNGYYLTGDTVSYLQDASRGKLLSVFIQSNPSWPPGTSLVFNMAGMIVRDAFLQQKLLVLFLLFSNIVAAYLLAKELSGGGRKVALVVGIGILLLGVQSLLFLSAMSESIFILWMNLSVLFMVRFHKKRNEADLALFALGASMMPFTRYIGLYLLAGATVVLAYYLINAKEKVHSRYFLACAMFLIWIPTVFYLFRNKLLMGVFMDKQQIQLPDMHFFEILFSQNLQLLKDIGFSMVLMFVFGLLNPRKIPKHVWVTVTGTVLLYQISLALSKNLVYFRKESFLLDNFPSRYMAVIYPVVLIFVYLLGNIFGKGKAEVKNLSIVFVLVVLLGYSAFLVRFSIFSYRQLALHENQIKEADFSSDVEVFCLDHSPNQFLLVQDSSSNHIARGLNIYCSKLTKLPFNDNQHLVKDSIIYTPYILDYLGLRKVSEYYGTKTVYKYHADSNVVFNAFQLKKGLHLLD